MYWMYGWTVNKMYFNVPRCDDTSPFPLGYPDPANHIFSFSLTKNDAVNAKKYRLNVKNY